MKHKKTENTLKSLIIFIVAMVLLFVIGEIVGMSMARMQKSGSADQIYQKVSGFFSSFAPRIYVLVGALLIGIETILYFFCKAEYKELQRNKEDDVLWDRLENHMNIPVVFANVLMIVNVFAFGIMLVYYHDFSKIENLAVLVLSAAIFVLILIYTNDFVKMQKQLNPEKRGNIFDFRFSSMWLQSSGEAERQIVYRASYSALKATNVTCGIMWAITFIGMILFDTGIFAYSTVCLIWLVSTAVYSIKAAQLERI